MNYSCDNQGFDLLYKKNYSRFIAYADSYLKDRVLAEDFVSEAFTTYWEKRNNLKPDSNPPAYILTIVKNKCLSHFEHLQVRTRVEKEIASHAGGLLHGLESNFLCLCDKRPNES